MPNYKILFFEILLVSFIFSCKSKTNSDQKTETQTDFCAQIKSTESGQLDKYLAPFTQQMTSKTGVQVLEDGGGSLITRAWFCKEAQKTIDIQYFIFSVDNVGLIACDFLVQAADRGVKIRLLVDDMMVDAELEDILTLDAHPNIEIKIYNPNINLGKNILSKIKNVATDFNGINQRMHNKTFIVDQNVAITGGRNIADEYFDYDHEYNFRDRDVLLIGKEVKQMNTSFELFWSNGLSIPVAKIIEKSIEYDSTAFEKLHQYTCNPENFWPQVRIKLDNFSKTFEDLLKSKDFVWVDNVRFVTDMPGKNKEKNSLTGSGESTRQLIALLNGAKKSIDIQTPYLITTEIGKTVFSAAIKRGVKVRILTNSLASTDNLEAFSGYQRDRAELLKTGVRIFEFKPDAEERFKIMTGALQKKMNFTPIFGLHAKSMVVDGDKAVIGTFNLDPRSANLNTECFAVISDNKIAQSVLQNMETEFAPENAWETTSIFNPDSKVDLKKRMKVKLRRVVPKSVL
jgi:cardiolipin synthase C